MRRKSALVYVPWLLLGAADPACSDEPCPPGHAPQGDLCVALDASVAADAGPVDAGFTDAGPPGMTDAGPAGMSDAGPADMTDAGPADMSDAGPPGMTDASLTVDAGPPDACVASVFYLDGDGDGYGKSTTSRTACVRPVGYVRNADDCNDSCADCHPGGTERCDGLDDDCDGMIDEAAVDATRWYVDCDLDTYAAAVTGSRRACAAPPAPACGGGWTMRRPTGATSSDCNDGCMRCHPGGTERCDGLDDDCDGMIDEAAVDAPTWYADRDRDGYGDPAATRRACTRPSGYVSNAGDCNDGCMRCHPGGTERCDGLDDDCDGMVDEGAVDASTWYVDCDLDTYAPSLTGSVRACTTPPAPSCGGGWTSRRPAGTTTTDCNDSAATVNPGATTWHASPIPGAGGFDYNCDGTAEPRWTNTYLSTCGFSCSLQGWTGAAPACGMSGDWFYCEWRASRCVPGLPTTGLQNCR